jgi:hypothetical protein
MKIPLSAILNLSTILIFFFEKVIHSHGRVMLHRGPTKLKINRGVMTLLCFRVVCPKLSILGKITNDHLEIIHEGFEKDSYGRVLLHGGPTKLKNQSWSHDALLFQSGLPKTVDFGKNRERPPRNYSRRLWKGFSWTYHIARRFHKAKKSIVES